MESLYSKIKNKTRMATLHFYSTQYPREGLDRTIGQDERKKKKIKPSKSEMKR